MTSTNQMISGSPCGCGSRTATAAPGCGCGGTCGCGCDTCQNQVYSRPQFFAGQLLTEDDLQSLVDYVVAKNRLHNRYLFGDGVVCGLTVVCAPCECGHVIVNPGYALDCCGNDIVVSCPKDLDINQMVQQLILRLRGADCGDPCADTATQKQSSAVATPSLHKKHPHRYCLYINHCEQPSDPVAPYATNGTCGQAVCEPTRILENFRFELRCPEHGDYVSGIAQAIRNCFGDVRSAQTMLSQHEFLKRYVRSLKEGVSMLQEHPRIPLDSGIWERIKNGTAALQLEHERFEGYKVNNEVNEAKLEPVLDKLLDLARDIARVRLQPDRHRPDETNGPILNEAEKSLRTAHEKLNRELIDKALQSTLSRLYALGLLELIHQIVSEPDRLREEAELSPHSSRSVPIRLLSAGAVFTRDLLIGVTDFLAATRDWLVNRLEQSRDLTICEMLCKVEAVRVPVRGPGTDSSLSSANAVVTAGDVLIGAVVEVLRACLCNALLPPCQPCDDPGVLLACLTVEDCKVTEICNLDRKFVLTGPNLRYWFPEIAWIGEAIEKWCCPPCKREDDYAPETYEPVTNFVTEAIGRAPALTRVALSAVTEHYRNREKAFQLPASLIAKSDEKTVELQKQLDRSLAEIRTLKRDYARLRERVAKIEEKKPEASA